MGIVISYTTNTSCFTFGSKHVRDQLQQTIKTKCNLHIGREFINKNYKSATKGHNTTCIKHTNRQLKPMKGLKGNRGEQNG